ncbi:GAF domain-containing SpoIIE family protein phosphatase [Actinocrispum sp. NPDC049592]|uniref:PP2C family protein-serine/threonine phosphatase n=1 Tax=Actinocrispum sp. NPDC049592 TaxID=3154835 RepID=UPI00343A1D65
MVDPGTAEDRLRMIQAVTDSALSQLELDELLKELLERVRELLVVDTATVLLHDRSAGYLTVVAAVGIEEEVRQGVRIQVGRGFAGSIAQSHKPRILDHVDATTVVNPLLWERGLRALLGVPLMAAGQLVGVLHVGTVAQRAFTGTDIDLLQVVADRIALAVQAQLTSGERAAATALQRSLLPSRLPDQGELEFAARYVPGADNRVGGDWYDVFPLPGDRWGIVMGDVVGHGLPAAVIMGRLRSALRAYALLHVDDPAEVLTKLDRKVSHFEPGAMATVAYAVTSPGEDSFCLSVAGHPPPVLARPGQPACLVEAPADVLLGSGFARPRHNTVVAFPPGSVLCLYTDGLVERRSRPLDDGFARLRDAVDVRSPEAACVRIMAALSTWEWPEDDVALLVARHRPAHPRPGAPTV